jgi:hypothetical protein
MQPENTSSTWPSSPRMCPRMWPWLTMRFRGSRASRQGPHGDAAALNPVEDERTKPSKREYQVMVAVDDSKSMRESNAVSLAFETLAVVTKALS